MDGTDRTKFDSYEAGKPDAKPKLLNNLRKSNIFCDASIRLDDGTCIPIHRFILSTACDYFHKLFVSQMNDANGNIYEVHYVRGKIMDCIIDFAYAFDCDVDETNLIELIATAEYFCFFPLVDHCAEFLMKILNPNNCISLMRATRKFLYRHEIRKKVRDYILCHFLEIITSNKEEMLSLPCEELLDFINDDALNTKTEVPIWEFCLKWIEFDVENRLQSMPLILRSVRLGLLDKHYFKRQVLDNDYVRSCPEAMSIIKIAHRFVFQSNAVEWSKWIKDRNVDVSLLVPRIPYELLFVIGGWVNSSACGLLEIYDNRADRWIKLHQFDDERIGRRAYHRCCLIENKIYCIGGYCNNEYYNKCAVFDLKTMKWKEIAPMHFRRCYVSVCAVDGKIYAMGGHDGQMRLRSCEVYCRETNQWTLTKSMLTRRSDADACEFDGKIYVFGGFDGFSCLRTVEVYDPVENRWYFLPGMQSVRSGLKCVVYKNQIHVIGGYDGRTRLDSCEIFNPKQNRWLPCRNMNSPRSNFGIEVIDDEICVAGGFDGTSTINKVEFYKPENNEWYEIAALLDRTQFALDQLIKLKISFQAIDKGNESSSFSACTSENIGYWNYYGFDLQMNFNYSVGKKN